MKQTSKNEAEKNTADPFDVEITAAALRSNHSDFTERSIPFHNGIVKLFYINQLTDRAAVTENVIKPLMQYGSLNKKSINAHMAVDDIIFADDCKIESDIDKIEEFIISGMVVILFSTGTDYIVANFKKVEHRPVATPNLNYTLRGPQDCFTENLDMNISLLRYRLKDKNTKIEKYKVGVRTKTQVAVVYIADIANDTVVTEIQKRIQAIDIDGIGESGELQAFLLNKKTELFPNVGLVERSDMALHSLLEGKVLVLVEGSGLALLAPKTFSGVFLFL